MQTENHDIETKDIVIAIISITLILTVSTAAVLFSLLAGVVAVL